MVRDGSGSDDLNLPTPQPIDPDAVVPDQPGASTSDTAQIEGLPSEFGMDDPAPPVAETPAPTPAAPSTAVPAPTPQSSTPAPVTGSQPPLGPTPAQAVPGTPLPPPPTTVPAKGKGTPWGWIIGCTCGGCLGLVLLFVLLIFIAGVADKSDDSDASSSDTTSDIQIEDSAGEDGTTEGTETVSLGPGVTEAEKFGRELKAGWVAEVSTNSPDFEEVSLRLGPTAGDWQRWAKIRWDNDADGYTLVEEGDIAYDDTSPDGGTTTTGPGKHLATKTALANSPGWVAKVVRHAADWSTAVVWIGPPQSEWVSEVRLRWNSKLGTYELEGETMIPQEGGP